MLVISELGRQRQEDPGGLLAAHSSLIIELRTSERSSLKGRLRVLLRTMYEIVCWSQPTYIYIYVHKPSHVCIKEAVTARSTVISLLQCMLNLYTWNYSPVCFMGLLVGNNGSVGRQ